jgi:hypothetical protein
LEAMEGCGPLFFVIGWRKAVLSQLNRISGNFPSKADFGRGGRDMDLNLPNGPGDDRDWLRPKRQRHWAVWAAVIALCILILSPAIYESLDKGSRERIPLSEMSAQADLFRAIQEEEAARSGVLKKMAIPLPVSVPEDRRDGKAPNKSDQPQDPVPWNDMLDDASVASILLEPKGAEALEVALGNKAAADPAAGLTTRKVVEAKPSEPRKEAAKRFRRISRKVPNLWKMAEKEYGKGKGWLWPLIAAASGISSDQVTKLRVGRVVTIPSLKGRDIRLIGKTKPFLSGVEKEAVTSHSNTPVQNVQPLAAFGGAEKEGYGYGDLDGSNFWHSGRFLPVSADGVMDVHKSFTGARHPDQAIKRGERHGYKYD